MALHRSSLLLSGATATSPWKFFPPTDQAGAVRPAYRPGQAKDYWTHRE